MFEYKKKKKKNNQMSANRKHFFVFLVKCVQFFFCLRLELEQGNRLLPTKGDIF